MLPDLDSNQDKQSQSLSYYRYTIRQYSIKKNFLLFSAAKITYSGEFWVNISILGTHFINNQEILWYLGNFSNVQVFEYQYVTSIGGKLPEMDSI